MSKKCPILKLRCIGLQTKEFLIDLLQGEKSNYGKSFSKRGNLFSSGTTSAVRVTAKRSSQPRPEWVDQLATADRLGRNGLFDLARAIEKTIGLSDKISQHVSTEQFWRTVFLLCKRANQAFFLGKLHSKKNRPLSVAYLRVVSGLMMGLPLAKSYRIFHKTPKKSS